MKRGFTMLKTRPRLKGCSEQHNLDTQRRKTLPLSDPLCRVLEYLKAVKVDEKCCKVKTTLRWNNSKESTGPKNFSVFGKSENVSDWSETVFNFSQVDPLFWNLDFFSISTCCQLKFYWPVTIIPMDPSTKLSVFALLFDRCHLLK